MKNQFEPVRLVESSEAPGDLRRLLVRAHEDVPSFAEREQFVRAVLAQTVEPRPIMSRPGSGTRWASRAARTSGKGLWVAAVVGVGAGGLFTAAVRHRYRALPEPAAQQARADEDRAPSGPMVEPIVEPIAHPVARPALERPRLAVAEAQPEAHAVSKGHAWSRAHSRYALHVPSSAGEGARGAETEVGRTASQPPLAPQPLAAESDQPEERANPVSRKTGDDPKPAVAEAALLRSARQALATSPDRTLSLTDEHQRRYPNGLLSQEREALAIQALIELGRLAEASSRAEAFDLDYRDSPHRIRIRAALNRAMDAATGK